MAGFLNNKKKNTQPEDEHPIDQGLRGFERLNETITADFQKGGEIPRAPKKKAPDRPFQLDGLYGDAFYSSRPSKELMEKEKKRQKTRHTNKKIDDALPLIEKGLCDKYGVVPPTRFPNRRQDRGEGGEQILILGQTLNDRRNPKLWGIRQEDRTRHMMVLGPSGSGKANTLSTPILAEKGWIPNGDLSLGDKVYTRNGNLAKVIGIFPQKEKKSVWELELEDGQVIECDSNHNWIVIRKSHGTRKELVKTTEELYNDGIKAPDGEYRNRIPLCKPVDLPEKCLPLPPYVMGMMLGGGYRNREGLIEISGDDIEHIEDNHEKYIPEEYLWGSIEQRRSLLQGLMDADGTADMGYCSFTTASHRLADNVLYLVRSLGYSARISTHPQTDKGYANETGLEYIVAIRSNDADSIFRLQRKRDTCRERIHEDHDLLNDTILDDAEEQGELYDSVAIVDIRKTERHEDMQCIMVDDPTGSYLCNGDFTVTHNSTLLHAIGVEDMWYWRGGLLMEPHGDLAQGLLHCAPPYRIHDIIYLNVLDPLASPGFNPLELPLNATDEMRQEAVGAVTSLIAKHFNMDTGYVKLLRMLTIALNALSYCPCSTLLEVMDFYNNEDIRNTILEFVPAGPLRDSYADVAMNAKNDDLASLDNRISRFSSNRFMKHLFGQTRSTMNFFELMNEGAFIICPASKGGTNDDIFLKFYGSYIVSEVYKAAVMRDSIPEGDRVNFAMTLDEFQNFLGDDIEGILSEARKYGLCLTLANQYLAQLTSPIKSAVLQNCATKLCYNLGPADAPEMAKTFGFGTKTDDMMSIPKYTVLASPLIKGGVYPPFLSAVFPPITVKSEVSHITADLIVENTRNRFMTPRAEIDEEISRRKEALVAGKDAVIQFTNEIEAKKAL